MRAKKATAKAPSFEKLTKAQKTRVTKKLAGAIRAMNYVVGPKYKVVTGIETWNRDRGAVEGTGEDGILNYTRRCQMLDMARNLVRNSSTACSILKQFDLQAVGTVGGKATFALDGEQSREVLKRFAAWTRNAEFYDGMSLNSLLKVILRTYILGGDMVLVFDDGLVEDSGRVMLFEPDEIGDLDPDDLVRAYGQGAFQSQGRIKNANGRAIGVVVSKSQRGARFFKLDSCYTLEADPNAKSLDNFWIMPRNVWRKNQGRGVAPIASSIATITDLEDLTNYELQAAKKNSQTLAQVVSTGDDGDAAADAVGSAFAAGTDFSAMTDSEVAEAVQAEADAAPIEVTLDQIKGAGCLYEAMPDGKKLELLDTKHPNANMPEFIRWLAGRSAAPFGLGSVYATLKADSSYTAFRGEQVMSQPAFEEAQKFLEGICDWICYRWYQWASRKGFIATELPDGWIRRVTWMWPRMREVNQVDEQNALAMKLKNGTGSYREVYGADWRERLAEIAEEVAYCKSLGLPHPTLETVSGMVIDTNNKETVNE